MPTVRIMFVAAVGLITITVAACGDGPPPSSSASGGGGGAPIGSVASSGAATTTVNEVTGQKFNPNSATVKVGQVVEWKNADTIAHNVTFDGHDEVSNSNMNACDTFLVKFTTAGSYAFHCTYHDGMTGTVVVQ